MVFEYLKYLELIMNIVLKTFLVYLMIEYLMKSGRK